MKYLILFAHPDPESFNNAVLEAVKSQLEDGRCYYTLRNIYDPPFDPVLKKTDLEDLQTGSFADDIAAEQKLINNADVIILIHPVWWFNMPAALKGYIDRVFASGFAFLPSEEGVEGLLRGKKVAIFNTTGGKQNNYAKYGFKECFRKCICDGIFRFCGMEILLQHFLYAVASVSYEERQEMLQEVRKIVKEQVIQT